MSKGNSKIEFKRMLRQYEFLLEDLNDIKEAASEINSEFSSALASKKRPDLFDNSEVKQAAESEEVDEKINVSDKSFKRLFRKIVVKCHPDRMSNDLSISQKAEYIDLYNKANNANDTENWALLITVAIKLEIELSDEYLQHVEKIKIESDKIKKEIDNIQGSVAWTWYHTEEESRDLILDSYVKHMESIFLKKNKPKIKKKILGIGHPRTGTGYTSKILKSMGLKVEHEKMGDDGVVAWQLASNLQPIPFINFDPSDYNFEIIIYNVRNPLTSIPSVIHTEERTLEYRANATKFTKTSNIVRNAVESIIAWDKLVLSKNPDFIYRIEDQSNDLFEFLNSKGCDVIKPKDLGPQNKRKHDGLTESIKKQLTRLPNNLKEDLNDYCKRYGYPKMF